MESTTESTGKALNQNLHVLFLRLRCMAGQPSQRRCTGPGASILEDASRCEAASFHIPVSQRVVLNSIIDTQRMACNKSGELSEHKGVPTVGSCRPRRLMNK